MSPQSMGHSQNDDIVMGHTLQFRSHCQTTTHPQAKMMTSAKLVPCSVAAINYVNEVALYPVKQWANIGENPFCGNATIEHSRQDTTRRGTNQNPPRLLTFKFCRIFLNLVPVGPQGTWCSYGISSNNEHHDVEEHHGVSWVRALGCFFFWALRVVRVSFHCVDTLTLRNTRDCMFAIFSLTSYTSQSKLTMHVWMF